MWQQYEFVITLWSRSSEERQLPVHYKVMSTYVHRLLGMSCPSTVQPRPSPSDFHFHRLLKGYFERSISGMTVRGRPGFTGDCNHRGLICSSWESNWCWMPGTNVSVGLVHTWQSPLFLVVLDICVEAINTNVTCPWKLLNSLCRFSCFMNEKLQGLYRSCWIWALSDFRLIEADAKSLNSLSGSGHSRKSSDTSQISLTSGKQLSANQLKLYWIQPHVVIFVACVMFPGTSFSQERNEDGEEDIWTLWGRVSNDWDNFWKKSNSFVRVSCGTKWCDSWKFSGY